MTKSVLGIYGARGHGRDVLLFLDSARASNYDKTVFIDRDESIQSVCGFDVVTPAEFSALKADTKACIIAIADPATRRRLSDELSETEVELPSLVASNAMISTYAEIGASALISPFCAISSAVKIGFGFQCNTHSSVAHDCNIGDFVTFGPGVLCNGNVLVGDGAFIGSGAVIKQGSEDAPRQIGAGAVVGMGAVVTRDVPAGATVLGNPARQV